MSHELFEDVWPEKGKYVYPHVYGWGDGGGFPSEITADSKCLMNKLVSESVKRQPPRSFDPSLISQHIFVGHSALSKHEA